MLITFKSPAAGDVIMFGEVAKTLLALLGKDPEDARGIVTTAQLPQAIATLRQAIVHDKAQTSTAEDEDAEDGDEAPARGMAAKVALWQRAAPLLALFEYSLREDKPVIWE